MPRTITADAHKGLSALVQVRDKAENLLPIFEIREFVNADEIARGLSPFNYEEAALAAGRAMLERLDELTAAGVNFAFETTCATHAHAQRLLRLREAGYRITFV